MNESTDDESEEIWDAVQLNGHTLIPLKMNRYESQQYYVNVCELKDYIDNILKKDENIR